MKKLIKGLPEVHILGDLKNVKKLVSAVNRKKTLVIFQDGDEGTFYIQVDGKFRTILQKDVNHLAKDYRLIFFSFFPSRKKAESVAEDTPAVAQEKKAERGNKEKTEGKKDQRKPKKI